MALPEAPNSRSEQYLAKIAGQETELPEAPNSRVEQYLEYIAENGTVSEEEIAEQVSAWLEDNIHEDPTVVIDASLSVSGAAADAKATGDGIANAKVQMSGDLNKVTDLVGNSLATDNVLWSADSVTVAATGSNFASKVLYEYTGDMAVDDVWSFSAESITGNTNLGALYIRLYNGNTLIRNVIDQSHATCTLQNSDIIAGLNRITFVFYPASGTPLTQDAVCVKPAIYRGYTMYPYSERFINYINNATARRKDQSFTYRGTLASGVTVDTELSFAPKYGFVAGISGRVNNFDQITLQFDEYSPNQIIIDQTSVTLKSRFITDSVLTHGVTIADDICISIIADNPDTVKVTVESKGVKNQVSGDFTITSYENIKLINGTSEVSDVVFTLGCGSINNNVWIIGDSYLSMTNGARWPYYLWQNNYTSNVLACGATGAGPAQTRKWISSLLTFGTPKSIVFCMGMNYSTDSEAVAQNWKNDVDWLVGICETNSIELILATIPTIATKNNEYKNAFVRNSGYRYIDFAKAVGADASGEWYDGMISSDDIHPSGLGAIALYHEAIASVPELTYSR